MALIGNFKKRLYTIFLLIIPVTLFFYSINIFSKSSLSNDSNKLISNNNPQQSSNEQTQLDECKKLCPYSSKLTNVTLEFDANNMIRHFPDFVCPQNFRNLADWVYDWPDQFLERNTKTTNQGKQIAPCLPDGSIIYVRQWAIDPFFEKVYADLKNNFVLITGEGDVSSPSHLELLDAPDSKIIHWFGQNGQYDVSKTKKFTHIPIGINCYEMADAIRNVYSQNLNYTLPPVFGDLDEPMRYIQPQDISYQILAKNVSNTDLVLINFDGGTDGSGLRKRVLKSMCPETGTATNYTFVKCISKKSGVQISDLPKIYQRNRQYPFWLSPRGSGFDCHRTWEALYLDIIPIVWNNSITVLYENLPVLLINDITDLNEKLLYEKLYEISQKKLSKEKIYQYEKLRNAYWRHLILSKSRHKEKNDIYQRTNRCWMAKSTINIKRS